MGFRKVLAHEYGDIDPEQVYQYLREELGLSEEFTRQVAEWFEARNQ